MVEKLQIKHCKCKNICYFICVMNDWPYTVL